MIHCLVFNHHIIYADIVGYLQMNHQYEYNLQNLVCTYFFFPLIKGMSNVSIHILERYLLNKQLSAPQLK